MTSRRKWKVLAKEMEKMLKPHLDAVARVRKLFDRIGRRNGIR